MKLSTTPLLITTLLPHLISSSAISNKALSKRRGDGDIIISVDPSIDPDWETKGHWVNHILWLPDSVNREDVNVCSNTACDSLHTYCSHMALGCRCIALKTEDPKHKIFWRGQCGDPRKIANEAAKKAKEAAEQQQGGGSLRPGISPSAGGYPIPSRWGGDTDWDWSAGGFGPSGVWYDSPCVCNSTCVDPYCCESSTGFIHKKAGVGCLGVLGETY